MAPGFTDWDHYNGTAELDAAVYVSSPSSLLRKSTALQDLYTLTKAAAAQSLADGRVVTQMRVSPKEAYTSPVFWFRYQDASNLYAVFIRPFNGDWIFYVKVAGVWTQIGTRSLTFTFSGLTWYKLRATFWTSEGHIWARLEYWDGSTWVKQGDDLSDPNNRWPSGGRVGIGAEVLAADKSFWFDDTEIWG